MPLIKKKNTNLVSDYTPPADVKDILRTFPVDSIAFSIELLRARYAEQSYEDRLRNIRTRQELEQRVRNQFRKETDAAGESGSASTGSILNEGIGYFYQR
jgi:hypothetical protein